MPLSPVQKGAIGQFTFLATALATGKGQVEAYTPAIDNEGRDAEIRRHLKPAPAIAIQVKVTFSIVTTRSGAKYLGLRFSLKQNRVQNDPRLWYFIAIYDARELRLRDPAFLVPAHVFHAIARMAKRKRTIYFLMMANLSPDSRDEWSPFRVAPKDLGKRLLQIVDKTALTAKRLPTHLPADSVWLGRAKPRASRRLRVAPTLPKYDLIRNAVLARDSVSALYQGHLRLLSPFVLGTKAGEAHVLAYQFGGTSHKVLAPDGSPENWRCLRVSELTEVNVLPGMWHAPRKGRSFQHCIDQVDVRAGRPASATRRLRSAA